MRDWIQSGASPMAAMGGGMYGGAGGVSGMTGGGAAPMQLAPRPMRQARPLNWGDPNGPIGNMMMGSYGGFGGQMQGAMAQHGATLNANANRTAYLEAAGYPVQQEQVRQQGMTNRMGMIAPLLSALFGGSRPGGMGGRQGGGFMTDYGQFAIPAGQGGGQGGGMSPYDGDGNWNANLAHQAQTDQMNALGRMLAMQRYVRESPLDRIAPLLMGGVVPGAVY